MKKQGTAHPKPVRPRYYFREWRKHRDLTQEQLADRIGVSSPTISQLERGIQGFRNETLEALADALNCTPADLLGVNPKKEGKVVDIMALLREKSEEERADALELLVLHFKRRG
jgi:transcriptional regulator with XRE-family HTH domain